MQKCTSLKCSYAPVMLGPLETLQTSNLAWISSVELVASLQICFHPLHTVGGTSVCSTPGVGGTLPSGWLHDTHLTPIPSRVR